MKKPEQNHSWYTKYSPVDASKLTNEGLQSEKDGKNGLWIIDFTKSERCTALEVPMGAWARMTLEPSVNGELKLYCRYPTGTVDLLLTDEVKAGYCYNAWYLAEWAGNYEVWYILNCTKSNSVRFQVLKEHFVDETFPVSSGIRPAMNIYAAPPVHAPRTSIGFAAGGAKDIKNFRENIEQGYMPLPTDVTHEGLFYDYYFETGQVERCEKLFCPTYSSAISEDPISGEIQRYLSVGLNSGITDFQRKKLNLVIVLDYSGSMGSPFSKYYYDRFGNRVEIKDEIDSDKTKMKIANKAVVDLLGHLDETDRFGMVIFSNEAFLVEPLTYVGDKDLLSLEERIIEIKEYSGTNIKVGMDKSTALLSRYLEETDPLERENRMIFLTDAMPNLSVTDEGDLYGILVKNANKGIFTTFIGIGVDFNTELVEKITKIHGANYYSVHSAGEFKERMDEEFDFMIAPLVFDLKLQLDSKGYRVEKVYGSPEADGAKGEIMKVNTLFPSKTKEREVRGGIILIKLKKISPEGKLGLKMSYLNRNGVGECDEVVVSFPDVEPNFYKNNGIRKAILLSRYADLLKNWIEDERKAQIAGGAVELLVTQESGIEVTEPVELGKWERKSLPLHVSDTYRILFDVFGFYFEKEVEALGDMKLRKEKTIIEKLSSYQEGGV